MVAHALLIRFHTSSSASMKNIIQFPGLLIAVVLIFSSTSQALAETTITETFSETGQRIVGDILDGTMTDGYSGSWRATPNLVIGEESGKGYAEFKNNELFLAKVPIPSDAKNIRLEAQVRVLPAGKDMSSVAIGFGNPPSFNITWLGGIFLSLNSLGNAELLIHPDNHDALDPNRAKLVSVATAQCEGFHSDDVTKLTLVYDVSSNAVSAWINEKVIVEGFKLSNKGFAPVIRFAGFSGLSQKPDAPTLKAFRMTVH